MSIDAIADASVGLEEEYIPMVVSYIDFLKSYKAGNILSADDTTQQVFKPKDAMNIFANSLCVERVTGIPAIGRFAGESVEIGSVFLKAVHRHV